MPDLTGLDAFRAQLEASGWRVSLDPIRVRHNDCNWCASLRLGNFPQFVVYPYSSGHTGVRHETVEMELCAELGGDWIKVRAFDVAPTEFFDRFKTLYARLATAWVAAASVPV